MNFMINLLNKTTSLKIIFVLLILFVGFNGYIFPSYQNQMNEIAGKSVEVLDTRMAYTLEEVNAMFNDLGASGRSLYKFIITPIDMIYPIVYGLFLIFLLTFLLKKITASDSKLILLSLLPMSIVLFDYLENFNTLNLLKNYPDLSQTSVFYGDLVTKIKWYCAYASLSLVLILTIIVISQKFKQIFLPKSI